MSKFDKFKTAVDEGTQELAKDIFNGFEEPARADGRAFLRKTETDLKRWTMQLALKQIDREEFCDFVRARQAVLEMHRLNHAGIAQIKLEKFRSGLIDLVINNACKYFV